MFLRKCRRTSFLQSEGPREWIDSPFPIQYLVFIRVVNGASLHQCFHQGDFTTEIMTGNKYSSPTPTDHTSVHEQSPARMLRHIELQAGFKRVERFIEIQRPNHPRIILVDQVVVPNTWTTSFAAHNNRI